MCFVLFIDICNSFLIRLDSDDRPKYMEKFETFGISGITTATNRDFLSIAKHNGQITYREHGDDSYAEASEKPRGNNYQAKMANSSSTESSQKSGSHSSIQILHIHSTSVFSLCMVTSIPLYWW